MKTVQDMLDWIRNNVDLEAIDQESPETALFWFVAVHEVENIHEGNTTKDWAHVLLNGHPKINIKFCEEWLQTQFELYADELLDFDAERDLTEFFKPR